MTSDFSRRNFLRKSVAAGAAGAAFAAVAPQALAKVVPAKANGAATETTLINLGANTLSMGPSKKSIDAIVKVAPISGGYEPTDTTEFQAILSKQLGVPADHIAVFPGSGTPLDLVVLAFTSPTASLVTADPTYEQAWRTSTRTGAKLIKVTQRKDFSHDVEKMVAADSATGMLYICNPNNPTGAVTMKKDIDYAVKNMPKGCTLVVDEAYIHFSDNAKSAVDLVAAGENVVVLRTFSKLYGMAGLRLGYVVASPANLAKISGGSGRSQGIVAATTISAGVAAISDADLIPTRRATIKKARTETIAWLEGQGYPCTKSEANCFMVDIKKSGKDFQKAMLTHGVNIGRTWPGYETWPRISVGTDAEMIRFKEAFTAVMAGKLGSVAPPQQRASLDQPGVQRAAFRDEQVDLHAALLHC